MSKFVKEIVHTSEFEGDMVTVVLRPAEVVDFMKMSESGTKTEAQKRATVIAATDMLPKYTIRVSGLKDDKGEELTSEEVYKNVYFLSLISTWVSVWLQGSQPKNSKSPAGQSSG